MIRAGDVALMRFSHGDRQPAKIRPVLVLCRAPSPYEDWLVCMISSQTRRFQSGLDELLHFDDADFTFSGLKAPSVVRVGQLLTTSALNLTGRIGTVSDARLTRIRHRILGWIATEIRS